MAQAIYPCVKAAILLPKFSPRFRERAESGADATSFRWCRRQKSGRPLRLNDIFTLNRKKSVRAIPDRRSLSSSLVNIRPRRDPLHLVRGRACGWKDEFGAVERKGRR